MMPLTLRMGKNFDVWQFKFTMGHSYALGQPRHRKEWSTALRIQEDFPSSVGIMMPMLIIGTSVRPQDSTSSGPSLDVQGDEFFEANCRMANSIIEATRNKPYELAADNFVSATFHGEDEHGDVKCLSPRLVNV